MRFVVLGVLVALGLCTPLTVFAQDSIKIETLPSQTPNGKPAVALFVNGKVVAQLAKGQRQQSAVRNISIAAALVLQAFREGELDLRIKESDGSGRRYALFLNGKVMLVATDIEGKAWGAKPIELAQSWKKKLQDAVFISTQQEPPVDQPVNLVELDVALVERPKPKGSGGIMSMPIAASRAHPGYSTLQYSKGHTPYTPPEHTKLQTEFTQVALTAQITGNSPDRDSVNRSVESAIRLHLNLGSSKQIEWSTKGNSQLVLQPGRSRQVKVDYQVGHDPDNVNGRLDIMVVNSPIPLPRESLTFFSNDPEGITQAQVLFSDSLPAGQSARLVHHHQNQGEDPLNLVVRLYNDSTEPTSVHIIPGLAKANINTFYVGYKSAEDFWFNLNDGNGYVVQLGAGGSAVIANQLLERGYTSSGYFKISNLGQTSIRVETLALEPGGIDTPGGPTVPSKASMAPYITVTERYQPGDPWLYLRLGDIMYKGLGAGGFNGLYGYTHSFNVEIHNPRTTPALIFVVLRASAGEVKGQFFIDDEYVVTQLVESGGEQLLKEIPLAPGQTKLLKIKAMPLNGSFYPASIILRQSREP